MGIIDLIPEGKENAINRNLLTARCINNGLVDKRAKDPDREMRKLVEKARTDWAILNTGDGKGYYRPSKDDYAELRRFKRQQESRIKNINKGLKPIRKILRQSSEPVNVFAAGQMSIFDIIGK